MHLVGFIIRIHFWIAKSQTAYNQSSYRTVNTCSLHYKYESVSVA